MKYLARATALAIPCLLVALAGCESSEQPEPVKRPNIVWIVWDTVRADRLSLYGHDTPTTPFLDEWAQGARVFDNCVTPGSTTLPSHASMFTGLLPMQHGVGNDHPRLDDGYETIAEIMQDGGYATYAYSENPYITAAHNFVQGFDVAEQPADVKTVDEANRLTRWRMTGGGGPIAGAGVAQAKLAPFLLKAPELVQVGVEEWLSKQDADQPVFIFLNYMEAHWPRVPARPFRQRMLPSDQVRLSYTVNPSWQSNWLYSFRELAYPTNTLELMRARYDASLLELDEFFRLLMERLAAAGRLDDTVVVVTSDHGEHLGGQHLLDHQYSVYEPLLRVPLVLWYPGHVEPGRESRPVVLFDLFPTLLSLAGLDAPAGLNSEAVSLLTPRTRRPRLAEYPAAFRGAFEAVWSVNPKLDLSRWDRSLRAYYRGDYKFIWGSDGRNELYNIAVDPTESNNLVLAEPDVASRLAAELEALVSSLEPADASHQALPTLPADHVERLRALGYVGPAPSESQPADSADGD